MIRLKSKKDIEGIRASGQILAETFSVIKEKLTAGITTKDIDVIAAEHIKKNNAIAAFKNYMGFPSSICISVNDEVIHGIPSKRVIKDGDLVSLDFGVNYKNYISDSAITIPVGKIDEKTQLLLEVTKECLELGIKSAIVGNRVSDISKAVFIHAKKHNFGVVREYCGHGVGFKVHEEPSIPNYIGTGSSPRLKPYMVIAIEPMINMGSDEIFLHKDEWTVKTVDNSLSAHFEHTIAILDEGPAILTL